MRGYLPWRWKKSQAAEQYVVFARIQSTDILRDVVRLFVYQQFAPELHVSSYDAWRVLNFSDSNDHGPGSKLIFGFRAQSDKLAETIDAVIERSIKERASIIIEGIHIHPGYYRRVIQQDAVVIPLLLTNPSAEKLKANFRRRGEISPSRSASQYMNNFSAIWEIQDYLITEAQRYGVPFIPNTDFDDTLTAVISAITKCLEKRFI